MKSIQKKEQSKDGKTLSLDDMNWTCRFSYAWSLLESFDYENQFELCFVNYNIESILKQINSLSPCSGQGLSLETAGIPSGTDEAQIWVLGAQRRVKAHIGCGSTTEEVRAAGSAAGLQKACDDSDTQKVVSSQRPLLQPVQAAHSSHYSTETWRMGNAYPLKWIPEP